MSIDLPLISVVMSVRNGASYLQYSLDSILSQTYKNLEFIIINDGSTDQSSAILQNAALLDNRIRFFSFATAAGLSSRLNQAIDLSFGDYIARMDADDISLPTRLEEQYGFMTVNRLDVCGCSVSTFGRSPCRRVVRYPQSDQDIRIALLFRTAFCHPALMLRRSVFDCVRYDSSLEVAQDYSLYCQIASHGFLMGNCPKVLFRYRIHNFQVSALHSQDQISASRSVSLNYISGYPCPELAFAASDFILQPGCSQLLAVLIQLFDSVGSGKLSSSTLRLLCWGCLGSLPFPSLLGFSLYFLFIVPCGSGALGLEFGSFLLILGLAFSRITFSLVSLIGSIFARLGIKSRLRPLAWCKARGPIALI